jgi:hypothetical protein
MDREDQKQNKPDENEGVCEIKRYVFEALERGVRDFSNGTNGAQNEDSIFGLCSPFLLILHNFRCATLCMCACFCKA